MDENRKLTLSKTDKMIAGVCAGLAKYFGWNITTTRILFVIVTLLGGSGIIAYVLLWILMPAQK